MVEISAALERGAHLVGIRLEPLAGELGLTQGDAHVLAQVGRRGPTSIAVLHHEFGHKRSTLTSIVDRLEAGKLVRRRPNPNDRRSLVVHPTPKGRQAANRLIQALDALERETTALLTTRDIAGLTATVEALQTVVKRPAAR
jgi:DNA-binding MarR family transcriptional regulator